MYDEFIALIGNVEDVSPDLVFFMASCFGIMMLYVFCRIITSVIFSLFNVR